MESRTEVAYIAVLTFIKRRLGDHHRILRVITDFEQAEQNAWEMVFQVQGCLYHVCAVSINFFCV